MIPRLLCLASLALLTLTSCTSTAQRQQEQQATVLQQSLVLQHYRSNEQHRWVLLPVTLFAVDFKIPYL